MNIFCNFAADMKKKWIFLLLVSASVGCFAHVNSSESTATPCPPIILTQTIVYDFADSEEYTLPQCWHYTGNVNIPSYYDFLSIPNKATVTLPQMRFPEGVELQFNAGSWYYQADSYMDVYFSRQQELDASAELIGTTGTMDLIPTYYSMPVNHQGDGYIILSPHGSNLFEGAHITDITIYIAPLCMAPANLRLASTTYHSATFAWSSSAPSFHVTGCSSDSIFVVDTIVSDTTLTIGGLNHSMVYDFSLSVTAQCSDSLVSEATTANKIQVATRCVPIRSLPWVENFDAMDDGTEPTCWTRHVYGHRYFGYIETENYALRICYGMNNGEVAVLPEFSDSVRLQRAHWYMEYACDESYDSQDFYQLKQSYGKLEIGAMSDPEDLTTFVSLCIAPQYDRYRGYCTFDQDLTQVPNNCHYLAIRYSGGDNNGIALIDQIRITPLSPVHTNTTQPTCPSIATKVVIDGHLYILVNGKRYHATGSK